MPSRTICQVLEEMRSCAKTSNYSYLPGLVEEAQTMANRMESALEDQADARRLQARIKAKIKELNEKLAEQGLDPVSKWDL